MLAQSTMSVFVETQFWVASLLCPVSTDLKHFRERWAVFETLIRDVEFSRHRARKL